MSSIPLSFLTASQEEKDHALIGAAGFGNIAVATMLLDAGASVKASRPSGWANGHLMTALNTAASRGDPHIQNGKTAVLDLLLERGVDAFTQEEKDQALFVAVSANVDRVRSLLLHGANPNAKRSDGQSPLHAAMTAHGDQDIMVLLLEAGADIDERDGNNDAPLRLAIRGGRRQAVRLLLDRGADTNVTHTPDNHVSKLAEPLSEIWTMLVLDPRTGSFQQRFEQVLMLGDSATLKQLLAQRTDDDDLAGGIPLVLDNAYMWTSGNRAGERIRSASNWWAEARRCVRALIKAGALDRTIDHHYRGGANLTIPVWFNIVRQEIVSGVAEFERTASTLSAFFIKEEQRALRDAIVQTPITTERTTRARL